MTQNPWRYQVTDAFREIAWILEYEDDIEVDLEAIFGVKDPLALTAEKYVKYATRLHGYRGIMRHKFERLAMEKENGGDQVHGAAAAQDKAKGDQEMKPYVSRAKRGQPPVEQPKRSTGPKTGASMDKSGGKIYFDDITKNPDLFSPGITKTGHKMPALFAPAGQDAGPLRGRKK